LDLLRATAVLMVVVFHVLLSLGMVAGRLGWLMGLGRWAVLIFFVHTSLVLMFSLERQSAAAAFGWRHYLAFLLRRCFRLLPLSTIVIAAVVALDLPVASVHHGHFAAVHPGAGGILANVSWRRSPPSTSRPASSPSPGSPAWRLAARSPGFETCRPVASGARVISSRGTPTESTSPTSF
jgi:peptidoglycan/LPS O-acetylase OafA/YrhL